MNKKVFFLTVLIITLFYSKTNFSQYMVYTLQIQLIKLKSFAGKVLLQMSDVKNELVSSETGTVENNGCRFAVSGLKYGKYLIRHFHDENGNNKLDTYWLGIPFIRYSFSNNASGIFGIPTIKEKLFVVNSNNTIIY